MTFSYHPLSRSPAVIAEEQMETVKTRRRVLKSSAFLGSLVVEEVLAPGSKHVHRLIA